MHGLALAAVVLANTITGDFTRYPAFLPNGAHSGIEAITDRGLIAELIVRCSQGVAETPRTLRLPFSDGHPHRSAGDLLHKARPHDYL